MKNDSLSSSFSVFSYIQVMSFRKGNLVLDLRAGQPVQFNRHVYFLMLFRRDTLADYLTAIKNEEYGKAYFLEGGLAGIDVILNEYDQAQSLLLSAEGNLKQARQVHHWGSANWWKGFLFGLEMAENVRISTWFDPRNPHHKLVSQMNTKRGKIE